MKMAILGAGHAGQDPDTGQYLTFPNKCAYHEGLNLHDSGWFYEGVFNRQVLSETIKMLAAWGIPYLTTLDPKEPWIEVPIEERVRFVNKVAASGYPTMYMEIHSNWFQGSARGIEVYTSPGQTESDLIADRFYTYASEMTDARMRPGLEDGDYDKEENFYILRKTTCPCVLTEYRYFSDRMEAAKLATFEEVKVAAAIHAETVRDWYLNRI